MSEKKPTSFSKLSKELKKIRIDHEITRGEMAKALKMPDRDLALIEMGKSPVNDQFVQAVANIYAKSEAARERMLETLRDAVMDSVKVVTFNMETLSPKQRRAVIELSNMIDAENAEAQAAAAELARQERERKAAARAERKRQMSGGKSEQPKKDEPTTADAKTKTADTKPALSPAEPVVPKAPEVVDGKADPVSADVDDVGDLSEDDLDALLGLDEDEEALA